MAQKVQIELVSDLALAKDPESKDPADVTRRFAVDGEEFEIDLSEAESEILDRVIAPYKEAGRRIGRNGKAKGQGRGARSGKAARAPVDTVKVREWARDNGVEIKDRGRVPAGIVAQYEAAQSA